MNTTIIRATTEECNISPTSTTVAKRYIELDGTDGKIRVKLSESSFNSLYYFDIAGDGDPLLHFCREGIEGLRCFFWTAMPRSGIDLGEKGTYVLEGCKYARALFERSRTQITVTGEKFEDVERMLIALYSRPQDFVLQSSVDESTETAEEVTTLSDSIEETNKNLLWWFPGLWRWFVIRLGVFWKWVSTPFVNLWNWIQSFWT